MTVVNTPVGSALVPNQKPWFETEDIVLSASQIDTFELCRRKWGFVYIDGERGQNEYAERGLRVHAVLAGWLRDGKMLDPETEEGRIAMPGLKFLPVPGTPGLQVEQRFYLETPVAKYTGFKDYEFINQERIPVVGDHKTTVDLKYVKTEEELKKNTQAVLYAAESMAKNSVDEVELNWIYYRTKSKRAKSQKVSLRVLRPEVEREMDRIDGVAREIINVYKQMPASADALPPTVTACDAYGGCPFREKCNLSPQDKMRSLMAQETLIEKLKKRANGTGAGKAPAPAPAASGAPPASLVDKIEARKKQGVNPAPAAAAPAAPAAAPAPAAPAAPQARAKSAAIPSAMVLAGLVDSLAKSGLIEAMNQLLDGLSIEISFKRK